MNIEELDLTIRSHNALRNAGITRVQDLIELDFSDIIKIKNLGEKSVSEIVWNLIALMKGQLYCQIEKFNKNTPCSFEEYRKLKEKADKYDKMEKIISPGHSDAQMIRLSAMTMALKLKRDGFGFKQIGEKIRHEYPFMYKAEADNAWRVFVRDAEILQKEGKIKIDEN